MYIAFAIGQSLYNYIACRCLHISYARIYSARPHYVKTRVLYTGLSDFKTVHSFFNIGGTGESGNVFALYAYVSAIEYPTKIWHIEYNGQITTNTGPSTFNFGLSKDRIKQYLGISGDISLAGGYYSSFLKSGAVASVESYGMGSCYESSGNYFRFSRYYNTDGASGSWGSTNGLFNVGNVIYGTIILKET